MMNGKILGLVRRSNSYIKMLELNVKMTKEDCIKICKYVNNVQSKPRLELMTVHTVIGAISWNIGVISYKETSCIYGM